MTKAQRERSHDKPARWRIAQHELDGMWKPSLERPANNLTVLLPRNGADAKQSTMDKLQQALEAAGVEFIDKTAAAPGCGCASEHRRQDKQIESLTGPSSVMV